MEAEGEEDQRRRHELLAAKRAESIRRLFPWGERIPLLRLISSGMCQSR